MANIQSKLGNPFVILIASFLALIILGTYLLSLPGASEISGGLSFIDALFMSTSAVCVTGLVVVTTGTDLTTFGQIITLILIQISSLGFMTLATMIAIIIGKKISFKDRLVLKEVLNQESLHGILNLVKYIFFFTFISELIGAIILTWRFSALYNIKEAFYLGIFHSVSAFNNAGFDLFGNSLLNFNNDLIVQLTIVFLFIFGGLGFIVTLNIFQKKFKFGSFSLHSKVVIVTTILLLFFGTLSIFIFETTNYETLNSSFSERLSTAFFQSATARTAGFNTAEIRSMTLATQFTLLSLMFIGASPGSTGGGIKTTTFATSFLVIRSVLKGQEEIIVFKRTLPEDFIKRSFVIMLISFGTVLVSTTLLTLTESFDFMSILFESMSAFGTVGLTLGITSSLTFWGKLNIIFTMFLGRIGPLTLFFALSNKDKRSGFNYPEEKIMIG